MTERKPIEWEIATEPVNPELEAALDRQLDTLVNLSRQLDRCELWIGTGSAS